MTLATIDSTCCGEKKTQRNRPSSEFDTRLQREVPGLKIPEFPHNTLYDKSMDAYVPKISLLDPFCRFERTPACDRQTDRRTYRHQAVHLAYTAPAQRLTGNNWCVQRRFFKITFYFPDNDQSNFIHFWLAWVGPWLDTTKKLFHCIWLCCIGLELAGKMMRYDKKS